MDNGITYANILDKFAFDDSFRIPDQFLPSYVVLLFSLLCLFALFNFIVIYAIIHLTTTEDMVILQVMTILTVVQAVCDGVAIFLYTINVMLGFGFGIDIELVNNFFCKFNMGFVFFAYGVSTDITVALSTGRYLCLYMSHVCDKKIWRKALPFILTAIIILNLTTVICYAVFRSRHMVIMNGEAIQFCNTNPPSLINHVPALCFFTMHIFAPAVYQLALYFYERACKNSVKKLPINSWKIADTMSLPTIAQIFGLFSILSFPMIQIYEPFQGIQENNTAASFFMFLAFVPKAFHILTLQLSSNVFKKYSKVLRDIAGIKTQAAILIYKSKKGKAKYTLSKVASHLRANNLSGNRSLRDLSLYTVERSSSIQFHL